MLTPPRSYRVLIVDDDDDSRELMESALAVAGYVTSSAAHAEAAIEQLAIEVPHAIITDLTLPQMSGEDLAAHVRGKKELAAILLIATSGRDVAPATLALFDIVRPKPIDFDNLIASMGAQLDARVGRQGA
ncbi:MAG: response regulator [Polyangiaceae bacterium]